jgi:hypothetical protein
MPHPFPSDRSPNMLNGKLIRRGVLVPAWLAVAACSSSSESTPTAPDGGASDGGGGDATASNDGRVLPIMQLNDAPSVQPIACGANMCSPPAGGIIPLTPCCLPDNSCGASLGAFGMMGGAPGAGDAGGGGGCLDTTAGTTDPSCPSQTVMMFPLTGCCSKAGVCGFDLSMVGLGCNSFGGLGGGAGMDAGDAAPPPAQPCGSNDAGVDAHDGAAQSTDAAADAASE